MYYNPQNIHKLIHKNDCVALSAFYCLFSSTGWQIITYIEIYPFILDSFIYW